MDTRDETISDGLSEEKRDNGSGDASAQPASQLALLRYDTLPAKDGGGIVFPLGPLGRGFRIDEWAFIRHSTRQSEIEHAEKTKPLLNQVLDFLPELAAIVIFMMIVTRTSEAAGLGYAGLYGALVVVYAAVGIRRWYQTFRAAPKDFRTALPNAEPVPYVSYWRERVILQVTEPSGTWKWLLFNRIFFPFLMAWQASNKTGVDAVPDVIIYALLCFGAWELLCGLALFVAYKAVEHRLGRAPKITDLEPV